MLESQDRVRCSVAPWTPLLFHLREPFSYQESQPCVLVAAHVARLEFSVDIFNIRAERCLEIVLKAKLNCRGLGDL